MELIFATNNSDKIKEVRSLINSDIRIISLEESGFHEIVPEDYQTFEENASQKAWYIYKRLSRNCFAEDSGLEVEALNNAPGVYSARYSRIGDEISKTMSISEDNIRKLLFNLEDKSNRRAQFRAVISLILNGEEYQFEGIVKGIILKEKRGRKGFGYDPVFQPDGYPITFAEMSMEEKNKISHRFQAVSKLICFLNDLQKDVKS